MIQRKYIYIPTRGRHNSTAVDRAPSVSLQAKFKPSAGRGYPRGWCLGSAYQVWRGLCPAWLCLLRTEFYQIETRILWSWFFVSTCGLADWRWALKILALYEEYEYYWCLLECIPSYKTNKQPTGVAPASICSNFPSLFPPCWAVAGSVLLLLCPGALVCARWMAEAHQQKNTEYFLRSAVYFSIHLVPLPTLPKYSWRSASARGARGTTPRDQRRSAYLDCCSLRSFLFYVTYKRSCASSLQKHGTSL